MVFSSVVFLFLFLALVLIGYQFVPIKRRNIFLLAVSLLFYIWGEGILVWIVIASTFIDYFCGLIISGGFSRQNIDLVDQSRAKSGLQKFGLVLSLCSNLAFLGYFKYFNFFAENTSSLLGLFGLQQSIFSDIAYIALPLGISFYTFQSMSYTIDVYRGQVKATRDFFDFACYVTLFPQLVAGPIVRYRDIEDQLHNHRVTVDKFTDGVIRFIHGLAKKVLIANTVAACADKIWAIPVEEMTTRTSWLGIITYSLQIYFDFSGYSDMAIGLGKMFGFTFLENFNYPYIAQSIQDFWRRWHISLSTWFRDYLYIPLGGNRKSPLRTYLNLMVVFFLCGLWHGASWNFVIWGMFHGLLLILERLGLAELLTKLPRFIRHVYVVLAVMVGWVFFRADNFDYAFSYLGSMFGSGPASSKLHDLDIYLSPLLIGAIAIGVILSTPLYSLIRYLSGKVKKPAGDSVAEIGALIWNCILFVLCSVQLASATYNPFIYFRF